MRAFAIDLLHMRPRTLAFVLGLSTATPASALSQPADARATAEDQFRRGRELMNKGDCKRALELFRASQSAEPGRGKLANIALCEEKLGLLVPALRHFQEVLPQLTGDERAGTVQ